MHLTNSQLLALGLIVTTASAAPLASDPTLDLTMHHPLFTPTAAVSHHTPASTSAATGVATKATAGRLFTPPTTTTSFRKHYAPKSDCGCEHGHRHDNGTTAGYSASSITEVSNHNGHAAARGRTDAGNSSRHHPAFINATARHDPHASASAGQAHNDNLTRTRSGCTCNDSARCHDHGNHHRDNETEGADAQQTAYPQVRSQSVESEGSKKPGVVDKREVVVVGEQTVCVGDGCRDPGVRLRPTTATTTTIIAGQGERKRAESGRRVAAGGTLDYEDVARLMDGAGIAGGV